jgi:hydrogenase maturation factor
MLEKILASMKIAANEAGIQVVAEIQRWLKKVKGMEYLSQPPGRSKGSPVSSCGAICCAGDVVLISGALGDHAMAVLSAGAIWDLKQYSI